MKFSASFNVGKYTDMQYVDSLGKKAISVIVPPFSLTISSNSPSVISGNPLNSSLSSSKCNVVSVIRLFLECLGLRVRLSNAHTKFCVCVILLGWRQGHIHSLTCFSICAISGMIIPVIANFTAFGDPGRQKIAF